MHIIYLQNSCKTGNSKKQTLVVQNHKNHKRCFSYELYNTSPAEIDLHCRINDTASSQVFARDECLREHEALLERGIFESPTHLFPHLLSTNLENVKWVQLAIKQLGKTEQPDSTKLSHLDDNVGVTIDCTQKSFQWKV